MIDGVEAALQQLPVEFRDDADLAFVAHSIPTAMEASSGPAGGAYTAQLAEAVRLVAAGVGGTHAGDVVVLQPQRLSLDALA